MPDFNSPTDQASIINDMQRRLRVLEMAARTGLSLTRFVSAGPTGASIDAVTPFEWSALDVAGALTVTIESCRRVVTIARVEASEIGNGTDRAALAALAVAVDGTVVDASIANGFAYGLEDGTPFAPYPHLPPLVSMAQHEFPQGDEGPHTFELRVTSSKNSVTPPNIPPDWHRPALLVVVLA